MSSRNRPFGLTPTGYGVVHGADRKLIEINALKPAQVTREAAGSGPPAPIASLTYNAPQDRRSGGPELEHAVGQLGRQATLDQHVVDMGDQFAGGEAHLVHVQYMLVEHHRHQFL